MLLKLQIRIRENCFSETALNLLVNQMHIIWEKKNYVIFLLLLNIIDVFDQIISSYLMHVLCMKRISVKLMKWVCIYMTDHIIILMLSDIEIEKSMMTAEILQNSLLSLILYLFYIIKLLNIYNNNNERLSMSIFMNDITLLTYRFSTEINCHMLTQVHDQCLNWAHRYDISFASEKYELIYLTHQLKRFNMWIQL